MPARKKPKPNPPADNDQHQQQTQVQTSKQSHPRLPPTASAELGIQAESEQLEPLKGFTDESSAQENLNGERQRSVRSSWYGGTWPRRPKAAAVAQVAKDTYNATSDAVSDIVSTASRASNSPAGSVKSSSARMPRALSGSSRSLPLAATTTKVNITSNETRSPSLEQQNSSGQTSGSGLKAEVKTPDQSRPGLVTENGGLNGTDQSRSHAPGLKSDADAQDPGIAVGKPSDTVGGSWLSWFYQPSGGGSDGQQESKPARSDTPSMASREEPGQIKDKPKALEELPNMNRSWMGIWRSPAQIEKEQKAPDAPHTGPVTESPPTTGPGNVEQLGTTSKSKGWAFWSTEGSEGAKPDSTRIESTGELALAGSPSQNRPEKASIDSTKVFGEPAQSKHSQQLQDKGSAKTTTTDKPTGQSSLDQPITLYEGSLNKDKAPSKKVDQSAQAQLRSKAKVQETSKPKNLLLPSIDSCYGGPPRPSLFQQISDWLPNGQLLSPKHLETISKPPKIKKALAIGVHGYFPTPLIRSVLGQPTGTSIRFANGAASAIQRWSDAHNCKCDIEKVALEGEGRISERIDLLWNLLLNWIEKVRKADFILVACHSQGVPVANMLVSKLFSTGMIRSTHVAICAMAGVNLGPFPELRSRWIGGTAAELFEFGDPESTVSKSYQEALETNLHHGVKITYIGSIDDQLVSMESSTFGPAQHPHIYRAVFVDGKLHAPNFLSHLVGFALKLRNIGVTDHGLIRELSSPLAGSLYSGEGHSRIYDDDEVYNLAVRFALETTAVSNVSLQLSRVVTAAPNPYILPFSMRGMLEEDYVKRELHEELLQLLSQFDDWKPSTKVLKDVKFRLEGVRSKI